jgi:hypothetical protein
VTILDALADGNLLGAAFPESQSWQAWRVFLASIYALPMTEAERAIYAQHTGRQTFPTVPAREVWCIAGRRAGKSRIAALLAVFVAAFRTYVDVLAPGEKATVAVIAADRQQARVVFRYIVGLLDVVPMLRALVLRQTAHAVELRGDVVIEVHTCSYRTTRGYSFAAVIADECAFWRDETAASPDVEVLNALRPGLATIPGSLLIAISSPYARRGVLWDAYRRHYRQDGDVLVWRAPTRTMNPSVPQRIIDEALAADEASARAEYLAEFRSDIEAYISREVLDGCTVPGRLELPPFQDVKYVAFVDPSGGAQDAMTLAIAHTEQRTGAELVVLDVVAEKRPPFSPDAVVNAFVSVLRRYQVSRTIGDRYAGEWPREAFARHGVTYEPSARPKSDLYTEFLPLLTSSRVELLDVPRLQSQLLALERRTSRGGRDSIDHPPGGYDDLANAVAGAVVLAGAAAGNSFLFFDAPAQAPLGYLDQIKEAMPAYFDRGLAADPTRQCGTCANRTADGWCRPRQFTVTAALPACEFYEPIPASRFPGT